MMNSEQSALYQRLQHYSFDVPGVAFPFSQRLARENGWPFDYAQRVIEEYKRFAFLAVASGHHVTPSDQVDQVWHLHLLYTHLYWDDFCPNVLQRSLHHGPTKGGSDESQKFHNWYDRTQNSYEYFFGESPPSDIWPPASVRFHFDIEGFQRVNVYHHWVLPKVQWPIIQWMKGLQGVRRRITDGMEAIAQRSHASFFALTTLVIAAFALSGCGALTSSSSNSPFNPLNFNGPQFLLFYFVLLMVMTGVARWGQKRLGRNASGHEPPSAPLDAYQIAYLSGGPIRVASVAIATAVTEEYCELSDKTLSRKNNPPSDAHPLETATHAQLERPQPIKQIHKNLKSLSMSVQAGLQQAGLLHTKAQVRLAKLTAMPLFALLLIGCLKIYVGLSRGKPTGFLQSLCWITLGLGLYFLLRPLPPTQLAKTALRTERLRHTSPSAPMSIALASPQHIHDWRLLTQKLSQTELLQRVSQAHNVCLIVAALLAGFWFGSFLAILFLFLIPDYRAMVPQSVPKSSQKGSRRRRNAGSSGSSSSGYSIGCGYTSSSGDSGGSSGCSSSGCSSSGCASSGCGGCGA